MISIALGIQVDDRQHAVSDLRWLCAAIQHLEDEAGKLSPFMAKLRDALRRNLSELDAHSRFAAVGPQGGVGVKSQANTPAVPRCACGLRSPGANHPPPSPCSGLTPSISDPHRHAQCQTCKRRIGLEHDGYLYAELPTKEMVEEIEAGGSCRMVMP